MARGRVNTGQPAGRPPLPPEERRQRHMITLAPTTVAAVHAAALPHELFSRTIERLVCAQVGIPLEEPDEPATANAPHPPQRYPVLLSGLERNQLARCIDGLPTSHRRRQLQALSLLDSGPLGPGATDAMVASVLGMHPFTLARLRRRFVERREAFLPAAPDPAGAP